MNQLSNFNFSVISVRDQKQVNVFSGDITTEKAVEVSPYKLGGFVYLNQDVHFFLKEEDLEPENIVDGIYTVTDSKKVYWVKVETGNTVSNYVYVSGIFPEGTQFTHLKVAPVFVYGGGTIFLFTEDPKTAVVM